MPLPAGLPPGTLVLLQDGGLHAVVHPCVAHHQGGEEGARIDVGLGVDADVDASCARLVDKGLDSNGASASTCFVVGYLRFNASDVISRPPREYSGAACCGDGVRFISLTRSRSLSLFAHCCVESPAVCHAMRCQHPTRPVDLARLREAFTKAVVRRMMTDVPWGVLLSGTVLSS